MTRNTLLKITGLAVFLLVLTSVVLAWFVPQLSGQQTAFAPMGRVTRIEVTDNVSTPFKKIRDKKQVDAIVRFIDKHASGWSSPWAGVPVPKIVVNLYDGREFKGHFGAGDGFFETQREGDFLSKNISEGERQQFLDLIGMGGEQVGD